MNTKITRCLTDIVLFIILIVIDRATKIWAVERLMDREAIPLIPKVLELYYLPSGNTGAAFGILTGHRTLFLIISTVVIAAIVYIIWNMPSDRKYKMIEVFMEEQRQYPKIALTDSVIHDIQIEKNTVTFMFDHMGFWVSNKKEAAFHRVSNASLCLLDCDVERLITFDDVYKKVEKNIIGKRYY